MLKKEKKKGLHRVRTTHLPFDSRMPYHCAISTCVELYKFLILTSTALFPDRVTFTQLGDLSQTGNLQVTQSGTNPPIG